MPDTAALYLQIDGSAGQRLDLPISRTFTEETSDMAVIAPAMLRGAQTHIRLGNIRVDALRNWRFIDGSTGVTINVPDEWIPTPFREARAR